MILDSMVRDGWKKKISILDFIYSNNEYTLSQIELVCSELVTMLIKVSSRLMKF